MTDLNKMYPGVANSPETFLKENVAPEGTTLYVNDTSVLGDLPTLAVIGTDQNAETVLVKSKRSDGGLDVQRAVEGIARKWEKATIVARNFTNYDYKILVENINKLNSGKIEQKDLKTKLSEMTSDSTHRVVTDKEKSAWDNKVDKVAGKGLSTNDYTDAAKKKVDAIPSSPKYTDTVTTINGKTGAISKADITALGIPATNTTYPVASQSSNGLMSAADKKRLDNIREQVPLSEAQYSALSSVQQNDSTKIYFIKA